MTLLGGRVPEVQGLALRATPFSFLQASLGGRDRAGLLAFLDGGVAREVKWLA